MASIEKRCKHPRAEWGECGCTWYHRQRAGGRTRYTRLGPDRAKAQAVVARLEARQDETMPEALESWIAAKEREPGARANSIATYHGRAGHIRDYFGSVPVRSVRPEDLTRFPADLLAEGYKPATVQGIYAALTSTLRHAQRRGVIRDLPLPPGGPGIPTPQPREHDLTLAQVEEVVDRMPGVWGKVAELVLLTGLRWGEINSVTRADIDGRMLHVRRTTTQGGATNPPKTKAGARAVPLSPRARRILRGMDLPVNGDYRQARLTLVAAMGDLHQRGMGWHTIRAAHSSLLDVAGFSLRDSSARMGHGHHYAQTLAYRVTSEAGDAGALDRARER